MNMAKIHISLKYKLLVLLVSLPVIALSLYLVLATHLFESDKIAYVFDSTSMAARSLSSRVRLELETEVKALSRIAVSFDLARSQLRPILGSLESEKNLLAVQGYQISSNHAFARNLHWVASDTESGGLGPAAGLEDEVESRSLIQRSLEDGLAIEGVPGSTDILKIAMPWVKPGTRRSAFAVVAWVRFEELGAIFTKSSTYVPYLVGPRGNFLFESIKSNIPRMAAKASYFKGLLLRKTPEGTEETGSESGPILLASFSKVGRGQLVTAAFVKKEDALHAIDLLFWKSILFFVALISFSLILSVFASGQLTSTLRALYIATQKVSSGDFSVQVQVKSNDEVGSLAESFNKMAGEISRLISETADKARMEKELETAKTVQETLFPDSNLVHQQLQLSGYYQPASECGGDWWYYSLIQGKLFVWIGDATGHGAPAALITSAARSAASVIENLPDVTPGKAMRLLNQAIHSTSKGKMMMTFFIASIDPATGEFVYSNASHDPPFLLRNTGQKLTKKDIEPLNEVNNPRLGQESDFEFSEARFELGEGDSLLFYTDGVPDVKNPAAEAWGQKNFYKAILAAISENQPVQSKVDAIRSQIEGFRCGAELPDDVTFFLCQYGAR